MGVADRGGGRGDVCVWEGDVYVCLGGGGIDG